MAGALPRLAPVSGTVTLPLGKSIECPAENDYRDVPPRPEWKKSAEAQK
jgi:hypothetical protein